MPGWRRAALALVALGLAPRAGAQTEALAVRYAAAQLDCARFLESAESNILSQSGRRTREQTSGRRGVWQFRAHSSNQDLELEGWLDSLAVWRRSAETTIRPDTDGLLGGRYKGTLSPQGAYSSRARPFVPDEVKEVAGMGTALDDFFPLVPPRSLRPRQAWRAAGVTIRRLPDSALSGVPLYRFELEARRSAAKAILEGDTLPLKVRQVSQERGRFVWHPVLGLLRRERRILVETNIPAGRSVRQPVRSKIEQRITVVRDLSAPGPCAR